jgi:flagellar motor switch protein FliN/FliY
VEDNAAEANAEDTHVVEYPRTRGSEGASAPVDVNTGLMLDIPVQLSVQLGQTEMLFKDLLELCPGAVIELDESVDEPVDLLINGKLIATGEVVTVDGRLGVRVLDIAHFQSYQDGKQG